MHGLRLSDRFPRDSLLHENKAQQLYLADYEKTENKLNKLLDER